MSQIINLSGVPINPSSISQPPADPSQAPQPQVHEPRWYRRRVRVADERFHQIYAQFTEDMQASKTPGTSVDREAVRKEYGHQWAQYAAAELAGPEPVPLHVNAMYEAIDEAFRKSDEKQRLDRLFNAPLHTLTNEDMHDLGWALVDQNSECSTWICTDVLLSMDLRSGLVSITPRPRYAGDDIWYAGSAPVTSWSFPMYAMAELAKLMTALRMGQPVAPAAHHLDQARQAFASLKSKS